PSRRLPRIVPPPHGPTSSSVDDRVPPTASRSMAPPPPRLGAPTHTDARLASSLGAAPRYNRVLSAWRRRSTTPFEHVRRHGAGVLVDDVLALLPIWSRPSITRV